MTLQDLVDHMLQCAHQICDEDPGSVEVVLQGIDGCLYNIIYIDPKDGRVVLGSDAGEVI